MNAKSISRRLVGKFQKVVMATLVLTMMLLTIPNGKVQAWSNTPLRGRSGSVSLPAISVGEMNIVPGIQQFTFFANNGPTISRSPASTGTQIIKVIYVVERWSGSSWVAVYGSPTYSRQISAGVNSAVFPAPLGQPQVYTGYFRFTYLIDWMTTTGGLLGSSYIQPTLVNDHVCVTRIRSCLAYAGYVLVR